jgi:predicted nucleic acid-binding protein
MNSIVGTVIDTSVIIKWFLQQEILADRALLIRQDFLDGHTQLYCPVLALYECANVLCYKQDWSLAEVQSAVTSLLDMSISWYPPSPVMLRRAVEIARQAGVTVYDAAFVALAEIQRAPLITADQKLVEKLPSFGFVHFLGNIHP